MNRECYILMAEYNDFWNVVEFFQKEEDDILHSTGELEKAFVFESVDYAEQKMMYLEDEYPDNAYYIMLKPLE